MKNLIKQGDVINFYIRTKYGADLPVNFISEPHRVSGGDNHEKIEKILMAKKKSKLDILPSLTDLYDRELNLKENKEMTMTEEEIKRENF